MAGIGRNDTGIDAHLKRASWIARIAVSIVFAWNIQCALTFLLFPENAVEAYELSGVAGETAVQGIAVAFLMWNATYPLVIFDPNRHRTVFGIVLAQQLIGLLGESWISLTIQRGHDVLAASISRFILFDAIGLIIMAGAFVALMIAEKNSIKTRGC